jgi:hypothetical protein
MTVPNVEDNYSPFSTPVPSTVLGKPEVFNKCLLNTINDSGL